MAVTVADVRVIAPDLASVPSEEMEVFLADARVLVNPTVWGTKTDLAVKYRAAHMAYCARPDIYRKHMLRSESLAGQSVSYDSTPIPQADDLGSTAYGRMYLMLLRGLGEFIAVS